MIKRIKGNVIQFLNDIKLRNKLMLSYFALIIIPLGLLALISYNQASKTLEGQALYSAKQNFEQTKSFLDYKISKIIDISDIVTADKNLNAILTKDLENYSASEQIKDAQDLNTLYLTPYQKIDDIYRIRLYVRDSLIYSHERFNIFSMKDAENLKWYQLLVSKRDKILWCLPQYFSDEDNENNTVISAARIIRDPNFYNKIIGFFRIDILESNIQNIIKNATTTKNGLTYLQNIEGNIVTSSNPELLKKWKVNSDICTNLSFKDNNWEQVQLNNDKVIVGSKKVLGTDWILVSVVPYEEILSASSTIRTQILFLLFVLATIAYISAYYISVLNTKRIGKLIYRMRKAQNGELEIIDVPVSKDEIGELIENFNFMIHRVKILIEEQYRTAQEIKSAELKALQAQINPHFLYNTLDLINWTAIRNNVPEISSVVQSLAKFYKLSLSKGKDIVTIANEIMHVKLYVDIQNRRFENKIVLYTNVDDNILEYSVLKIILQPIVENSILHGILEKGDKSGTIVVSGELKEGIIILTVKDDGVGIPESILKGMLEDSSNVESHGYGIKNINNRIKIHYGEQFGLTYRSEVGVGTEVEIRFPAEK